MGGDTGMKCKKSGCYKEASNGGFYRGYCSSYHKNDDEAEAVRKSDNSSFDNTSLFNSSSFDSSPSSDSSSDFSGGGGSFDGGGSSGDW
jgi:uncharacterized membrane protein YgcG